MDHQLSYGGKQKKTIYYDGSCPMCRVVIEKVSNSSQKEKFDSKDVTQETLPSGITPAEALKEIHTVDASGKIHKNADAILSLLEEYPKWRFWVKIGRLPIIKQLLQVGYKCIALRRHFLFGPTSRIFLTKAVVAFGFIVGLLISSKLWQGIRLFPLVPVIKNISPLPIYVEAIFFALILFSLVMVVIAEKPKKYIFTTLAVLCVYVFYDQMRLQPWVYQYSCMLLVLYFFSWKSDDKELSEKVTYTLQLLIASIYFFSGLQKLNPAFVGTIFPWMIAPFVKTFPLGVQSFIGLFGILAPFIEMGIGIGLLTKKYRKYAIGGVWIMTSFILLSIGPLGHNWNSVVWPWNIAMILFVMLLFWKTESFELKSIFMMKNFPMYWVIVILFTIMPFFNFFNLWDSYLSASLYSGNTLTADLYIDKDVKNRLPEKIQSFVSFEKDNRYLLDFSKWSFDELHVPPYPEERVYARILDTMCTYAVNPNDVLLVVHGKQLPASKENKQYNCPIK